MDFLLPFGLLACSALWLRGLPSLWQRASLLVTFLGLLFVVLPEIRQDSSLVNLGIYQHEATAFAGRVVTRIERGETEVARQQLQYFSKNQNWSMANDPGALRSFYKNVELAGQSTQPPGSK